MNYLKLCDVINKIMKIGIIIKFGVSIFFVNSKIKTYHNVPRHLK